MAAEGFYRREVDKMPYFDFSTEKFMVQANMASCVFGCQKLFPAPQNNLPARLKARDGSTPKSLRLKAKKLEQKREK